MEYERSFVARVFVAPVIEDTVLKDEPFILGADCNRGIECYGELGLHICAYMELCDFFNIILSECQHFLYDFRADGVYKRLRIDKAGGM